MPDDAYIFQSQKGNNQPLDRTQAYRIINDACRYTGIQDKIGTHTLRKTFGYFHYQQYRDVAMLQHIFNHSSPSIKLKYIGITNDIIDDNLKS